VLDRDAALAEIARLGRFARTRVNDFQPRSPSRWDPTTVLNPETGLPFCDASAWQFICDLIESDPDEFAELILDKPPGQIAYWRTVTLSNGLCVYIKVQFVGGIARGRSFHIST
jgi:hypothetical protein